MASDDNGVAIIINSKAGANLAGGDRQLEVRLREALQHLGAVRDVKWVDGKSLARAVTAAVERDDVDTLVMAGGDGSVSYAGNECARTGKTLLPLPFGTYNLVCRSLALPVDPNVAISQIPAMMPTRIDMGTANGHGFLHHVSAGLHPRFIEARNALPYRSRWGKMRSAFGAMRQVLKTIARWPVRLDIDGHTKTHWIAGLAITVNKVAETPGMTAVVDDPAGGALAVYLADVRDSWGALLLLARYITGGRRPGPFLDVKSASNVIVGKRRSSLTVSIDGETRRLELPLTIKLRRRALKVLAPERMTTSTTEINQPRSAA